MMLKKHINTSLQLTLVVFLFLSAFLVKPEFFNGIVTGKQYGLELAAFCVACYLIFFLPFRKSIRVTLVDTGIIILCLWYLLGEIITGFPFTSFAQAVFNIGLWMTIYLFTRQSSGKPVFVWGVTCIWLSVILVQALTGLMQLHGRTASHHYMFNITGTFHNPGPFAGFIVSALPLALGVILALKQLEFPGTGSKGFRILGWRLSLKEWEFYLQKAIIFLCYGVIITLILVIPAARSRAAWVAGLAGCGYLLWKHPGIAVYRSKLTGLFRRMSFLPRLTAIIFVLILLIPAGMGLYLMKQGSASGRVLMWKVTWEEVKEKPLFGHGTGSFNALYMPAQARWFKSGKGTDTQVMVSGAPQAPFNEFLRLWLEKGIIGVLVAGVLIFYMINSPKREKSIPEEPVKRGLTDSNTINVKKWTPSREIFMNRGNDSPDNNSNGNFCSNVTSSYVLISLKGALLSILVFGLFSYPFDISSFILQVVILVGLLAGFAKTAFLIDAGNKYFLRPGLFISIILLGCIVIFLPIRNDYYNALKKWKNAEMIYNFTSYHASLEEYENALPVLSTNGLFLQMYGKALSMDGQYEKSIEVLENASVYYNSHILYNTLGDNFRALGKYDDAEAAYLKSSFMRPEMLLPRYLLAQLYEESDQSEKARKMANEVLNSPVKIESRATREIISEMERLIMTREKEEEATKDPLPGASSSGSPSKRKEVIMPRDN